MTSPQPGFTKVNLKEFLLWDIRELAPEIQEEIWPPGLQLVELDALVKRIRPNAFSVSPVNVVRPSLLDTRTGAISRVLSKPTDIYFDWETDGIRDNDLMLCANGAIFITDRIRNVLFSAEFIALRPATEEISNWLWAILNSTAGKKLLSHTFRSDPISLRRDIQEIVGSLLAMQVPRLESFSFANIEGIRATIANQNHDLSNFENVKTSWTRKVNLGEANDWYFLARVHNLKSWSGNYSLKDLAEVISGRHHPHVGNFNEEDMLPLVNIKFVNRQNLDDLDYVSPVSAGSVGLPGDLLLASIQDRTYFFPLTFKCVLGQGVIALRPISTQSTTHTILEIFQSRMVKDQIKYFQSKGMMGMLTAKDVASIRIPIPPVLASTNRYSTAPLSAELDNLLWN